MSTSRMIVVTMRCEASQVRVMDVVLATDEMILEVTRDAGRVNMRTESGWYQADVGATVAISRVVSGETRVGTPTHTCSLADCGWR